jgi:hypothetical protein
MPNSPVTLAIQVSALHLRHLTWTVAIFLIVDLRCALPTPTDLTATSTELAVSKISRGERPFALLSYRMLRKPKPLLLSHPAVSETLAHDASKFLGLPALGSEKSQTLQSAQPCRSTQPPVCPFLLE